MKEHYIDDVLDEDKVIDNQRYAVLSYLLPDPDKNELNIPMIKIRGSYKTVEECQKRITYLQRTEKYFHLYIVEVGKWGGLYDQKYIEENLNVDTVYQESQLNDLMKGYKENMDKVSIEFEERKQFYKERAELEKTEEGREYLKSLNENPVAIQSKIEYLNLEFKKALDGIKGLLKERETCNDLLGKFSEEELKVLEKGIQNPMLTDDKGNLIEDKKKAEITEEDIKEFTQLLKKHEPVAQTTKLSDKVTISTKWSEFFGENPVNENENDYDHDDDQDTETELDTDTETEELTLSNGSKVRYTKDTLQVNYMGDTVVLTPKRKLEPHKNELFNVTKDNFDNKEFNKMFEQINGNQLSSQDTSMFLGTDPKHYQFF